MNALKGKHVNVSAKKRNPKMRTPEVERWIARVKSKANCRTRWEGQEPFEDESVVAYIESLEKENEELKGLLERCKGAAYYAENTATFPHIVEKYSLLAKEIERAVENAGR